MKKFIVVFLFVVLVISFGALSVSAEDYVYTPKQLFGNVTQAFVTGSDGSLSQQDVYSLGDYGYGMLPFAYPIKNFEMQFTFQIDTDVTTNDYIIFSMNFDRVTYGYQFSFITYSLYVLGGGVLKEQSFSFAQRNNEFQFQGFSTYNGEMSIEITFTYADVGVSEEEYYFSDINYYKGLKDNAPIYEPIDDSELKEYEEYVNSLNQDIEPGTSLITDIWLGIPQTLNNLGQGIGAVSSLVQSFFVRNAWLQHVLSISLALGLFAFLLNITVRSFRNRGD